MSNLIDLVGKKFWKLEVLSRNTENKTKNSYWICQCECGNVISVSGTRLRYGKTKSCGCDYRSIMEIQKQATRDKYIGMQFGEWTVLSFDRITESGHTHFLCRCSCGTVKSVEIGSLTSGKSKSCGCMKPAYPIRHTGRKKPLYSNEKIQSTIDSIAAEYKLLDVDRACGAIKIKVKCPIEEHKAYWTYLSSFLDKTLTKSRGCRACCTIAHRKTNQKYSIDEIQRIVNSNNFEWINKPIDGVFTGYIQYRCLVCGHVGQARPIHILNARGCKKCSGHMKPTQSEFEERIRSIDPDYKVLGQYKKASTPILMEHLICGHQYYVTPNNFLCGRRCPRCSFSRGEDRINTWLTQNNVAHNSQHKFEDCIFKHPLRFDFYLPDFNMCIEYQGKQHYEPVDYFGGFSGLCSLQKRDNIKREYCKSNGVRLLEIPYWDYGRIETILEEVIHNR